MFYPRGEQQQRVVNVSAPSTTNVSLGKDIFVLNPVDEPVIKHLFKQFSKVKEQGNWPVHIGVAVIGFISLTDDCCSSLVPCYR